MADAHAPRTYRPTGLLAIAPSAVSGIELLLGGPPAPGAFALECDGALAVVDVCGPLAYAGWLLDTYDAVVSRVRAALASDARAVVLRLSTPGGDVAGAFDAARDIRAAALAAGKPLLAWSGSQVASAGYALATAATAGISCSDTAVLGSVGAVFQVVTQTERDRAEGVEYTMITSGPRKDDGNPHVQLDDAARASLQARCDQMAGVFFDLVAEHRGARLPDPRALDAAVFVGRAAVDVGLADRIESWSGLCARVNSGGAILAQASMPKDDEKKPDAPAPAEDDGAKTKAAIAKLAGGTGPAARRAQAALAAYQKAEDAEAEGAGDDADAKAEGAADSSAPPPPAKDEAAAHAAAQAQIASLSAQARTVQALSAEVATLKATAAAHDLATFKATRPDVSAETWTMLDAQKLPLATLQAVVAAIPRGPTVSAAHVDPAALAIQASASAGRDLSTPEGRAAAIAALPPAMSADLQPAGQLGTKMEGTVLQLGVRVPSKAVK